VLRSGLWFFIFEFFRKIKYHKNRKLKRTRKLAAGFLAFGKKKSMKEKIKAPSLSKFLLFCLLAH